MHYITGAVCKYVPGSDEVGSGARGTGSSSSPLLGRLLSTTRLDRKRRDAAPVPNTRPLPITSSHLS